MYLILKGIAKLTNFLIFLKKNIKFSENIKKITAYHCYIHEIRMEYFYMIINIRTLLFIL